jgi:hypothetical protein
LQKKGVQKWLQPVHCHNNWPNIWL